MSTTSAHIANRIDALRARQEEFCVVTVVRTQNATSAKAGAKAVVTRGGEIYGFVGGGCVQAAVQRVADETLTSGTPRLIRVKPKEEVVDRLDSDGVELHKSSCPSGGTVDLFMEPMLMAPRCFVCGASPVAAALVSLASAMGYRTVAAALAADHARLAGPDLYIDGFDLASLEPRPQDAIIVATQGKRDREALQAARTAQGQAKFTPLFGQRTGSSLRAVLVTARRTGSERCRSFRVRETADCSRVRERPSCVRASPTALPAAFVHR